MASGGCYDTPMGNDDESGALEREVSRGMLATHARLAEGRADMLQVAATVFALADLLVERGLVSREDVEARTAGVRDKLGDVVQLRMQRDERNKYDDTVNNDIDCAARIPLCHAACCTLDVPLSRQDVEEGVARWDFGRPYILRRGEGGYCNHLAEGRGCGIYEQRPLTCRTYSCAGDKRIWLDFEGRVPNRQIIDGLRERVDNPRRVGVAPGTSLPGLDALVQIRMRKDG